VRSIFSDYKSVVTTRRGATIVVNFGEERRFFFNFYLCSARCQRVEQFTDFCWF